MKKVLALSAALFLLASVSNASIFRCWLVPGTPDSSGFYSVQIYGQVLPDPAIPGEDITNSGLSDFAITVYTPGTVNATTPKTNPLGTAAVISFVGTPWQSMGTTGSPAAQDFEHDGDKDAVEFPVADPDGWDITIGTGGPVLLATETWKNVNGGTVTLAPYIADTSRHWNPDYSRELFSKYENVSTTFVLPGAQPPAPVIGLAPKTTKINTSTPGGTSAGVILTVSKISGGDPTSGSLAYGDGNTDTITNGTLPFNGNHTYNLTGGETSHTFNASASATNGGGTGNDSATVTVVQAPVIQVLINGVAHSNGDTLSGPEFFGHNNVTISLVGSGGFIENWSMINNGNTFNNSGTVISAATWTGDVYNLYDNGNGFVLTVSNTGTSNGLGLNSQSITLHFVPEPATMALLGLGGLGALLRRRKTA